MPELPEVETIRRQLEDRYLGAQIVGCDVLYRPTVQTVSFEDDVTDSHIVRAQRRGKYLILNLSRGSVVIHLRMSGAFVPHQTRHTRCVLHTDRGSLFFHDPRKFGRVVYSDSPECLLAHLGVEPLGHHFTVEALTKLLASARQIKPLLLDQTKIAGLGNIYVDEALWRSRIHPEQPANSITQVGQLHHAIQYVLERGISTQGTSLGSGTSNYQSLDGRGRHQTHLDVYQRTGLPCLRCETPIVKSRVAQRGTHICPRCQHV